MNKTTLNIFRLLLTVLMVSALIFTGCSCSDKKDDNETKNQGKGIAATVIGEDGSVVYVEDITEEKHADEEDIGDLEDSNGNNKSDSGKSGSNKSSNKSSNNKSDAKNSNSQKSSNNTNGGGSKNSDSKKSDSGKKDSGSKSDDKEKTTKKSNFDIQKGDDDNRFGPIIDGKKKK